MLSGSKKKLFYVLYCIVIYVGLGGFRKVCRRDNEQVSRAGMSRRCQLSFGGTNVVFGRAQRHQMLSRGIGPS
jgi:hypothetical protein